LFTAPLNHFLPFQVSDAFFPVLLDRCHRSGRDVLLIDFLTLSPNVHDSPSGNNSANSSSVKVLLLFPRSDLPSLHGRFHIPFPHVFSFSHFGFCSSADAAQIEAARLSNAFSPFDTLSISLSRRCPSSPRPEQASRRRSRKRMLSADLFVNLQVRRDHDCDGPFPRSATPPRGFRFCRLTCAFLPAKVPFVAPDSFFFSILVPSGRPRGAVIPRKRH